MRRGSSYSYPAKKYVKGKGEIFSFFSFLHISKSCPCSPPSGGRTYPLNQVADKVCSAGRKNAGE